MTYTPSRVTRIQDTPVRRQESPNALEKIRSNYTPARLSTEHQFPDPSKPQITPVRASKRVSKPPSTPDITVQWWNKKIIKKEK